MSSLAAFNAIKILDREMDKIQEALKQYSYYDIATIHADTYKGIDKGVKSFGIQDIIICRQNMDEEEVHQITKAIHESVDFLKTVRRVVGMSLVFLASVFIALAFPGKYMPSLLAHKGTTLKGAIRFLCISTDGIFGVPIGISASYVILFIVSGPFLQKSGGGKLFTDIAFGLVGHSTGRPAKAAGVSSDLMGMLSGVAVANVISNGTFTIFLIKRTDYNCETAGVIESAASSGEQIMPPIMGVVAFMMAEMCRIKAL